MNLVILKETERTEYKPGTIVKRMQAEGYTRFNMASHTDLWHEKDGRNPKHQHGVEVEGNWFWYGNWVSVVREYCEENEAIYEPAASIFLETEAESANSA